MFIAFSQTETAPGHWCRERGERAVGLFGGCYRRVRVNVVVPAVSKERTTVQRQGDVAPAGVNSNSPRGFSLDVIELKYRTAAP
ncbi:MAG: hypothetical protein JWL75_2 [Parcubacteria group bacterium]|nr:hypothetical protein [Parcubacteria group bacterium]